MIEIQGIDHVAFNVKDLDKSLEFYTKVIGLKVTEREPSKPGIEYFLDCGPSLLGVIQAQDFDSNHPFAHEGLGANHFSFRIHADDFDSFISHLESHNVKIEYAKKRDKSWSLYFYDLDGNKLEATSWPIEDKIDEDKLKKVIYKPDTGAWGKLLKMKLKVGDKAPLFNLPASGDQNIKLNDFKGKKKVVLYFYPKDDTPGCTVEACNFRDSLKKIEKMETVVLGVSPDPVKKHNKFVEKYELSFPLLSDEEKKTCQDYGVWVEKNMYGRKYMGVARTTFIIGKDGTLKEIFEKVKPKEHDQQVLEFLKTL